MSTTVAAKIAEIKEDIDIGSITDAMLLRWVNEFEGSIYDDVKTYNEYYYKAFYLPRIKDQTSYTIGSGYIPSSRDIVNVNILDNNNQYIECKKIDHRSTKNAGYYYWFDNRNEGMASPSSTTKVSKLCISKEPQVTDNIYLSWYVTKNSIVTIDGLNRNGSEITFTSNSITIVDEDIDFLNGDENGDNNFCVGAMVTIYGCNNVGANGEFVISSVSEKTLTFEGEPFTPGTETTVISIFGSYFTCTHSNIDISAGDYICVGFGTSGYPSSTLGPITELIDNMSWQAYIKCIHVGESEEMAVLSFPFSSLPTPDDSECFNLFFNPGIKITYIAPYTKKLIANVSTDTLILDDKYGEAYNYYLAAKIHETQRDYTDAEIKFAKADAIVKNFKEKYQETEESYPADNQVVAEW